MDTFISDLAQKYISKLQHKSKENLKFLEFQKDGDWENTIGMHSDGVSGKIVYSDGTLDKSEHVFIKFVSTVDQTHKYRPFVVTMFENEIHFYTEVVPFLQSLRSIEGLIPSFLDFKKETQQENTIAIMFQHLGPQWLCNNFQSLLDYPHLSLMMRKIGEFHAYSFAAKSKDQSQFCKLSSFHHNGYAISVELFGALLKKTLDRAMQPLRHGQRYVKAIPRLEKLIQNFTDFMNKTYITSPEDQHYVLGHLSYNQSNVLFSYTNHIPVGMVIMDWQSPTFVSLGVDIMCTLYADASQQTRDQYWDRLLDHYYDSLKTTFDNIVPSKDQVLEELKKGVGAAIYVVTYRANKLHLRTGLHDKSETLWSDQFVTEMLKDMINRGFL